MVKICLYKTDVLKDQNTCKNKKNTVLDNAKRIASDVVFFVHLFFFDK